MKKAVKYIVLSVSCIATFFVLLLMTLLLVDSKNLTNPTTLILPVVSFSVLIVGFIMITIWGFKFSDEKNHKQFLIIALCIFVASALLFAVSKATNSAMKESAAEKNLYFDVTEKQLLNEMNEFCGEPLINIARTDSTSNPDMGISAYLNPHDTPNGNRVHYNFTYSKETNMLETIIINSEIVEQPLIDNGVNYIDPYLHIYVDKIATVLYPEIDIDKMHEDIDFFKNGSKNPQYSKIYTNQNMKVFVSLNGKYIIVSIEAVN